MFKFREKEEKHILNELFKLTASNWLYAYGMVYGYPKWAQMNGMDWIELE